MASAPGDGTELLKPWNFLGDRSVFSSDKATGGWPLNGFRPGADHQENRAMTRGLDFPPQPPSSRKEKGMEIELMINHACDETSINIPKVQGSETSRLLYTWRHREGSGPREGTELKPLPQTLP